MDKSASKIAIKFAIKFLIWFIIFTIISTIGVIMVFASSIENVENSLEEMASALNTLVIGLVIADLVVAFLATKLSVKGATKKIEVTAENKSKVIQKIAIVLGIFAILVCALHLGIKDFILTTAGEESDIDIEELAEETEEFIEDNDLLEDEEEELEAFLGFIKMTNLYVFDSLFLILMIPVAKVYIDKKLAKQPENN